MEDKAKNLKNIKFYYLDLDGCKNYEWLFKGLNIEYFKIHTIPRVFYYNNGKVITFVGYDKERVERILAKYSK